MRFFIKKYNKLSGGFTLVEMLVAVSILSISVVTLLNVLGSGIRDTGFAKERLTAGYLAQEGIEYIRNMRDTFVLYSASPQSGWNAFNTKLTNGSCFTANGCYFDDRNVFGGGPMPMANLTTLTACSPTCPNLLYNSATGKYNYAAGASADFIRKIKVTAVSSNEIQVSSTIFFTEGIEKSMTLSENLYNWIE